MNDEIKIPTMKITPLKKICMTIGELPTSYLETMTYYEMLVWFTNYLRDSIIPAVNNNAEAVHELQALFVELQTYVNDYFDNLDVQEEINNKLDDMLESGQLEQIIEQFLQLTSLICFDNVADMKLSPNLTNGSFAQTLGYHSINDGGKALYKIRTITNNDIVDEGSIIALQDDNLIAELIEKDIVTPEMFGAYGDGEHDDYQAIQKAIDFIEGGIVELQSKTYLVSNTLLIHRGLKLTGLASFDSVNSCIKLMDNVNKPILQTPLAHGDDATHYMIIENILFNGNGLNQTEEFNLIEFFGGFIGSMIKNVYISNFFGTGLAVQNCDLQIDHLWIQNGYTVSNRYALHFNPSIASTDIVSMINMNHIYVENYRNKIEGNPRTTENDRANGIMIYRVGSININELHMEGLKYPVTIDGPSIININMIRTAHCGISTDVNNSLIYFTSMPRGANISSLYLTTNSVYKYWINKSFDSNELQSVERNSNYFYLPMYVIGISNAATPMYLHEPYFINNAVVNKTGNTGSINYILKTSSGEARLRTNGDYFYEIGSTMNQPSSTFKVFQQFKSFGTAGDDILFFTPVQLAERDTAASIPKDNIYMYHNGTQNYPVYQRVAGSNDGMNRIATIRKRTTAPTDAPLYEGEMYLDTTNKQLYVATGTSSSSDWTLLN